MNIITRLKRDEYIAMQTIEKSVLLWTAVWMISLSLSRNPKNDYHNDREEAYHAI